MNKQSRLEIEGLSKRKETLIKNDFTPKTEPYTANHDTAQTHDDNKHPLGKGTNSGGHTFTIPNAKKSKTAIDKSQFDTEKGGGSYDKNGRNNIGGRTFLQKINLYGPSNAYGRNSIKTEENVLDGQIVIK